jgi:hypothetical protein
MKARTLICLGLFTLVVVVAGSAAMLLLLKLSVAVMVAQAPQYVSP